MMSEIMLTNNITQKRPKSDRLIWNSNRSLRLAQIAKQSNMCNALSNDLGLSSKNKVESFAY